MSDRSEFETRSLFALAQAADKFIQAAGRVRTERKNGSPALRQLEAQETDLLVQAHLGDKAAQGALEAMRQAVQVERQRLDDLRAVEPLLAKLAGQYGPIHATIANMDVRRRHVASVKQRIEVALVTGDLVPAYLSTQLCANREGGLTAIDSLVQELSAHGLMTKDLEKLAAQAKEEFAEADPLEDAHRRPVA